MAVFVLIHGGCHGGWCWERVVPLLQAQGHTVLAPDLPGAGQDHARLRDVSLADRAQFVANLINQQSEPVILAGHSMGGLCISSAAELAPENIRALVYLAALLVKDGASMWESVSRVAAPMPELILSEDGKVNRISENSVREFFYNTTPKEWQDHVLPQLREESMAIGATPVHVTAERFGQVPRYYIETRYDRALVPQVQKLFREDWPCRQVFEMATDHSPFYSAPEELAKILEEIAEE
jgi:pimeloyl-ACP methyl ester carboxylesterase